MNASYSGLRLLHCGMLLSCLWLPLIGADAGIQSTCIVWFGPVIYPDGTIDYDSCQCHLMVRNTSNETIWVPRNVSAITAFVWGNGDSEQQKDVIHLDRGEFKYPGGYVSVLPGDVQVFPITIPLKEARRNGAFMFRITSSLSIFVNGKEKSKETLDVRGVRQPDGTRKVETDASPPPPPK